MLMLESKCRLSVTVLVKSTCFCVIGKKFLSNLHVSSLLMKSAVSARREDEEIVTCRWVRLDQSNGTFGVDPKLELQGTTQKSLKQAGAAHYPTRLADGRATTH